MLYLFKIFPKIIKNGKNYFDLIINIQTFFPCSNEKVLPLVEPPIKWLLIRVSPLAFLSGKENLGPPGLKIED